MLGVSAATVSPMTDVRTAVESAVTQLVDEHVPPLWRRRALAYVPMVVDRIAAAVEALKGGSVDR